MKNDQRRCLTLEIKKFYRISLRKKTRKTIPDDQLAELLKEKAIPLQEEPLLNTGNN
jgi:hypothetical protein